MRHVGSVCGEQQHGRVASRAGDCHAGSAQDSAGAALDAGDAERALQQTWHLNGLPEMIEIEAAAKSGELLAGHSAED